MSKRQLNGKERFALWNLVQAEYTASGKSDKDFALVAVEKLGFTLNDSHVASAREGLDIPNNLHAGKDMAPAAIVARVQALEAALQGLYRHLGWTPVEQRGAGHG